jgi:hypothetical protein
VESVSKDVFCYLSVGVIVRMMVGRGDLHVNMLSEALEMRGSVKDHTSIKLPAIC